MSGVRMKKTWVMLSVCAAFMSGAGIAFADEEEDVGNKVVASDVACPAGMVVSGMTGGEGDISKVCITPNSQTMPEGDTTDYGDPNTTS